jgi:uncharacterized protein with HEPN domain
MTSKASRVTERLQHIRGAIENAKNDLGALTKEQFLADGKTQRAVIESFRVNLSVVWNTIKNDLPKLQALLGGIDSQNGHGGCGS